MAYVYTEEEFSSIKSMYANGQTLEAIQGLFPDKSVASIRMKLVKAGVYQKAVHTKTTKPNQGATPSPKPTTKAGILQAYKAAEGWVGLAPW